MVSVMAVHLRDGEYSAWHGTELISFLGPKIWDIVPGEIKQFRWYSVSKRNIRKLFQKNVYMC